MYPTLDQGLVWKTIVSGLWLFCPWTLGYPDPGKLVQEDLVLLEWVLLCMPEPVRHHLVYIFVCMLT